MSNRTSLQTELEELLGSRNVYFQPPASVRMQYPAIVYSLDSIEKMHANDDMYKSMTAYSLTLIDKNPDTEFLASLLKLKYCRFVRFYTADNLNHWVFTLYH
jgi:hypothetical protein